MRDKNCDEVTANTDKDYPALAALNAALIDDAPEEFLIAFRQMIEAFGGAAAIAAKSHFSEAQVRHILSCDDPLFADVNAVMEAMSLRLSVCSESEA